MKKATFKVWQMMPLLYLLSACTYQNYEKINPEKAVVDCDTAKVVSYAAHIVPLLDKHCNACHSTKGALISGGGVILDTYDDVTNAGKSLYKVTWGNYKMPKNAAKLDSCDIYLLKSWVDKGNIQ